MGSSNSFQSQGDGRREGGCGGVRAEGASESFGDRVHDVGSSQVSATKCASRLVDHNDVAHAALLSLCQLLFRHFFTDNLLALGELCLGCFFFMGDLDRLDAGQGDKHDCESDSHLFQFFDYKSKFY